MKREKRRKPKKKKRKTVDSSPLPLEEKKKQSVPPPPKPKLQPKSRIKPRERTEASVIRSNTKVAGAAFTDVTTTPFSYAAILKAVNEAEWGKGRQNHGGTLVIRKAAGIAAEVRRSLPTRQCFVRDLYEGLESRDVEDALVRVLGTTFREQVQVQKLHPASGGTLTCTVTLPCTTETDALLKEGRSRVGLLRCRVREIVDLQQCYRCRAFGHIAAGCIGVDRSSLCNCCGKTGHRTAECSNSPHCALCAKLGRSATHRLGSGRCEAFRQALLQKKWDLLLQKLVEMAADIVVVSEQWRNRTSSWYSDASATAAIYVPSTRHRVIGSSDPAVSGFVWVELAVSGDFNAKSASGGSSITDRRGILLSELAASLQLTPANVGNDLTFRRGAGGSVVDVTFVDDGIVGRINNWKVLDDFSHSDHQYIWYEIVGAPAGCGGPIANEIGGWCIRSLDVLALEETFSAGGGTVYSAFRAEAMVEALGVLTKRTCDSAMTRKGKGTMRRPVYWWNDTIAGLRKSCLALRRLAQRVGHTLEADELYRNARKALKGAIKDSKKKCWRELCEMVDTDPWGLPYKIVRQKLRGRSADPYLDDPENLKTVVDGLFPEYPERARALDVPTDGEECPVVEE
ncbi:uncharacterized protein LOC143917820 [Arctopsyche grandis]|uniref:uncharacterized protein LOC143917820 n=1 Tax=Arctopsyche grandis TaxID=121162 RepID=UPI00406D81D7